MPVDIFKVASQIATPIPLAAFAIAAVTWIVCAILKRSRSIGARLHRLLLWVVFSFVFLGILAIGLQYYSIYQSFLNQVYRIRVTVVGAGSAPVENAIVWSSVGGEPKKVSGGWEFDVPNVNKPLDGEVIIHAKMENSSLTGKAHIRLAADYYPSLEVQLQQDESALIRGVVEDDVGHALGGVHVSVVGTA